MEKVAEAVVLGIESVQDHLPWEPPQVTEIPGGVTRPERSLRQDSRWPGGSGEVVLAVPSPEVLAHGHATGERVIDDAPAGTDPLVVAVEDAETLREREFQPLLWRPARRTLILRVVAAPPG